MKPSTAFTVGQTRQSTTEHSILTQDGEWKLLIQAQTYLARRRDGQCTSADLEVAWTAFYDIYSPKIRNYAFACGVAEEDVADCVQDVWAELLVRLPSFRLDPSRGKFDTWLYRIVRGKAVDLHRSHQRGFRQQHFDTLRTLIDVCPNAAASLEDVELFTVAWDQLKRRLSECNLQILRMRLLDQRPVAEVAAELGLSNEQVWYRYHRARREMVQLGSTLATDRRPSRWQELHTAEKSTKSQESAQAKAACAVSRIAIADSSVGQRGNCVDYLFQRLELGRRELVPEWRVEWNCDTLPRSVLYIRKMAIVGYAEICGPEEWMTRHWPCIVQAAITAGVAAGIATIIATPTAALPIFQHEFRKHLQGQGINHVEEKVQVALSAQQEANGPWCICKD